MHKQLSQPYVVRAAGARTSRPRVERWGTEAAAIDAALRRAREGHLDVSYTRPGGARVYVLDC